MRRSLPGFAESAVTIFMSALPLKADICSAQTHVCYGPKADIRQKSHSRMITTGRRFGKTYFVIAFINPSTIWSTLKLAGRWLGG
jgi:hypothetical protein